MANREAEQGDDLVVGVVMDMHRRPLPPPLLDVGDEVDERLLLGLAVVRPEGAEFRCAGVDLDETEKVLESPVRGPTLGPERITLEVEEDVTGRGFGDGGQRRCAHHLRAHATGRVAVLLDLQTGLRDEALEGGRADLGHRLGAGGH